MNLEKGINFGGWFSQCVHTEEHYDSFICEDDVKQVALWKFDHIRLPFDYELVQKENGDFIEKEFSRLEDFVKLCEKYNLNVILDLHKAFGYDFNDAGTTKGNSLFDSEIMQNQFINLWKKLSERFSSYKNVAFELLNEVVEENAVAPWNQLIKKTIQEIRKNAPKTPIIYGGIQWNSANTLQFLEAPLDENIIWTFHMYEPLIFTHQKAYWVPGMDKTKEIHFPETMEYLRNESIPLGYKGKDVTDTLENGSGKIIIEKMLSKAIEVASKQNVKLYCGEYGVIDQAPVEDTLSWFETIQLEFKKYKIGNAVWTYKKMDFGIIEKHYEQIKDKIIKAIVE
ncbi:MAG: cellulase family glycosylhydrolase [Spirochaetaceae bacterium]|nr:cellulase family glycosylhydrolase [Spirochaetaceae bacterium]